MATRGATSTTWKKGTNPVKKPGTKHKTTLAKEAIGVKNWEDLKDFIDNKGVEKCIDELLKMKQGYYVSAFLSLCEFVKPKLQRTTIAGDKDEPIVFQEVKTYAPQP